VAPKPGDFTSQLLGLIPLTESLDPDKSRQTEDLEADLARVLEGEYGEPPVVMAQTNLMLCIFRRLRAQNSNILGRHMDRVLSLATKGLRAARSMVATNSPWHHAANVPFQLLCLLLAIDSRASLSLLGDAMGTLQQVATAYNSAVMREAYNTAYLLILLHQRRKDEDARALHDVLSTHSTAPALSPATAVHFGTTNIPPQPTSNTQELSWLEDLIADMPSLREFDLEQFLVEDSLQRQDGPNGTFSADPLLQI
jgi:hypothetical protein